MTKDSIIRDLHRESLKELSAYDRASKIGEREKKTSHQTQSKQNTHSQKCKD